MECLFNSARTFFKDSLAHNRLEAMSTLKIEDSTNINDDSHLIKIYNPIDYHPYLYSLIKINWFIFGSLTWAYEYRRTNSPKAAWYRRRDFDQFINAFCGQYKFRKKNLAYYKATEYGTFGEAHCHFLIAGEGCDYLEPETYCTSLKNLWENQLMAFDYNKRGMGTADIVPYDKAKEYPGVKYCLKREYISRDEEREREDYLSKGLKKLIKATDSSISSDRNSNSLSGCGKPEDEFSLAF